MRYLSAILLVLCVYSNAMAGARLPAVNMSGEGVSARAAFGEEIIQPVNKKQADTPKVVSRKKVNATSSDVLSPKHPSSDLWARSEAPLRMPRMDEISVASSDAVLPEEKLIVSSADVKSDLDEQIALLNDLQRAADKSVVAKARPIMVTTPISGDTDVRSKEESKPVTIRREIIAMDSLNRSSVKKTDNKVSEPKVASVKSMDKMSPTELKKAFKKTYLSENKHLSTYQIEDAFDVASDVEYGVEGFTAQRDLSEDAGGIRPLEIKISFRNGDSALSRENYTLLSEYASIVVNNPKRAVQVGIPESVTRNKDARKLAARRLAIVEQVLRDTGIADQRIVPVLSQRDSDGFVLRIISGDQYETLTQQRNNMFGDKVSNKTYKSMSW
ncbi:MAG: hypothetical protein MJ156_02275 [Alphaproteobacteria bacterium]|nr:hypothetical protein [Alphaproteobacteria bacterium]